MNFKKDDVNKKLKDFTKNLERYEVLMNVFKMKYDDLSFTEKNEVRRALFDLEDTFDMWYDHPSLYRYMFANWDGGIVDEKVMEICDRLLFNNGTFEVKKTRACGMTSLLVTYMLWVCIYEKNVENKSIWVISPNLQSSSEVNNKFRVKISNLGNRPNICNKQIIEFNSWKIYFASAKNARNFMCGKQTPHLVVMDEVKPFHEEYDQFLTFLSYHQPVKTVTVYSEIMDEMNEMGGCEDWRDYMSIRWYHDVNKCRGLRFENNICGIENTIRISDDDIETVIGNTDYINQMRKNGWTLNSDWMDEWRRNMPKRYHQGNCDDEKRMEEPTNIDIINRITDLSLETGLKHGLIGKIEWDTLVQLFRDCKSMADVEKVEKLLLFIDEIKKRTEKKTDTRPYINFLKDVFEI